jgi:Fe-S-cluster containining protein
MADSSLFGGARLIGEGLNFECRRCGGCCAGEGGYVFLTESEGEGMARHLDLTKEQFVERFTRPAQGRVSLVEKDNGDCCFLGDKGCAVYPARPYQCRSWPFWFKNLRSDKAWEEAGRECPGIGTGRLHPADLILEWLDGSPFHRKK